MKKQNAGIVIVKRQKLCYSRFRKNERWN